MFKIEKGIPIPPVNKQQPKNFRIELAASIEHMDIDDSFVMPLNKRPLLSMITQLSPNKTKQFISRKISATELRVFRIA